MKIDQEFRWLAKNINSLSFKPHVLTHPLNNSLVCGALIQRFGGHCKSNSEWIFRYYLWKLKQWYVYIYNGISQYYIAIALAHVIFLQCAISKFWQHHIYIYIIWVKLLWLYIYISYCIFNSVLIWYIYDTKWTGLIWYIYIM